MSKHDHISRTALRLFFCLAALVSWGEVDGASRPVSGTSRDGSSTLVSGTSRDGSSTFLELLWSVDLVSGARSMPVAVDANGDGLLEVLVTTRFDGTLWELGPNGRVIYRMTRPQWLEGGPAVGAPEPGQRQMAVFLESTGSLDSTHLAEGSERSASRPVSGTSQDGPRASCASTLEPPLGSTPCLADLDGDGSMEIVCAAKGGVVTAFNAALMPLWQFDGGGPIDGSPAVAPVFGALAAVYVYSRDGTLDCLSGRGEPLWRYRVEHDAPRIPSFADVTVAQLTPDDVSALVSDAEGWLYAIDAATGREQWRAHAGTAPLGSPAFADLDAEPGREILVVSEVGEFAILSNEGALLRTGALAGASREECRYVSRPLVADVDADGKPEVLVASLDWKLAIAALDGRIKREVPLRGSAVEGATLADINRDGFLELLVATDCARVSCFATRARQGWTDARGGPAMNGCAGRIAYSPGKAPQPPAPKRPSWTRALTRPARLRWVVAGESSPDQPCATAVIQFGKRPRADSAQVVVRSGENVVGSAAKKLEDRIVTAPYIRSDAAPLTADVTLFDEEGRPVAGSYGVRLSPASSRPIRLTPPEKLAEALSERAHAYDVPERWQLPLVGGRDSWHVVRYAPDLWSEYGIADAPFIREAIPRVWAPAPDDMLKLGHPAWEALANGSKPFFVMNDYFRPKAAYPEDAYRALIEMGGDRFLGFPVHEWAYAAWKTKLEGAVQRPETRRDATDVLRSYFDELLGLCRGRMYEGEGYGLFHHQAFAWGAPSGYAEVGENIPCAPLQLAFIRGAARQYGGRPWGAYVSNWFRGSVADTRPRADEPRVRWGVPADASGPDCGHSASLEFRLEMAAHLAGATFVHHESDAHNGSIFVGGEPPDVPLLSPFGAAINAWFGHARRYPDRGIPYTPIAFLLDFDHGWRPREDIYGVWPRGRADYSLEAVFGHVFPYGGRLDFERGYLANGPYGDIFDVLTNDASAEALGAYGVVWPLGDVSFSDALAQSLMDYVEDGGILVLDNALAEAFPPGFRGVWYAGKYSFATHIQTALGSLPPVRAPYRYRPMATGRGAQILAWTGEGDPILAWRRVGRGIVVTAGTDHWIDERNGLVPVAQAVLQALAEAFLPVRTSAPVEMLLNRTASGWVVALINNDGVTKVPTAPAVVDAQKACDCLLRFRTDTPLKFDSRMGQFRWNVQADGIQTRLAPGGVGVVELVFGQK